MSLNTLQKPVPEYSGEENANTDAMSMRQIVVINARDELCNCSCHPNNLMLKCACRQAARQQQPWATSVSYLHALGEATGLPDASQDVVSASYLVHECTAEAIGDLVREARRVLRPGGVLALTDNDPRYMSMHAT